MRGRLNIVLPPRHYGRPIDSGGRFTLIAQGGWRRRSRKMTTPRVTEMSIKVVSRYTGTCILTYIWSILQNNAAFFVCGTVRLDV